MSSRVDRIALTGGSIGSCSPAPRRRAPRIPELRLGPLPGPAGPLPGGRSPGFDGTLLGDSSPSAPRYTAPTTSRHGRNRRSGRRRGVSREEGASGVRSSSPMLPVAKICRSWQRRRRNLASLRGPLAPSQADVRGLNPVAPDLGGFRPWDPVDTAMPRRLTAGGTAEVAARRRSPPWNAPPHSGGTSHGVGPAS